MEFIPKVKMDFMPDEMNDETGEDNPQFVYEDEEQEAKVEEVITDKEAEEDINPSMNGINEEEIFEDIPKKAKKKRKPMSEEHKAKLKIAREKAMAVKKEKALERKKMKEDEKKIKELKRKETELQRKKAESKVKELESALEIKPIPINEPKEIPTQPKTLTKKDLEEAQLTAILKYEALRKERKKEKNIKKEQEKVRENMNSILHRALNPRNNFGGSNYSGF
tara:strand:- start:269 stop:937 length:669 start_codon:yes stop_codon:yes gene_type:complete